MKNKGFTLIEIMVVVGIITVLVGIAVVAGNSSRSVARDNERINNIAILRLKLEAYRDQNGVYPPTLDQLVSGKYISSIPVGMSGHEYFYSGTIFTVNGNGNGNVCASYHLGVLLENNSNSLDKAAHDEAGIACAGGNQSVLKDARDISNTPKNLWYDVVSPDTFKSQ